MFQQAFPSFWPKLHVIFFEIGNSGMGDGLNVMSKSNISYCFVNICRMSYVLSMVVIM